MKRGSASGLRPRIWPHLLRLVTNSNIGQAPRQVARPSDQRRKSYNTVGKTHPRRSFPLWSHADQDILCQTHRPAVYKRHTIGLVSPLPARAEGGGRRRRQNPVPHVTREHASRQNADQPEGESMRKNRETTVSDEWGQHALVTDIEGKDR